MGHVDRPQCPGNAIVLCFDAQKVEQDVQVFATIRLRGSGVPIAVLGMILGDALKHKPQPGRSLLDRQHTRHQFLDEPHRYTGGGSG